MPALDNPGIICYPPCVCMPMTEAITKLQHAVAAKVHDLRLEWPEYRPTPCKCKLWADGPWLYLLVSSPRVLNEAGKKERDRVIMEWNKHMLECTGDVK